MAIWAQFFLLPRLRVINQEKELEEQLGSKQIIITINLKQLLIIKSRSQAQ